jgi:hypothetical protein
LLLLSPLLSLLLIYACACLCRHHRRCRCSRRCRSGLTGCAAQNFSLYRRHKPLFAQIVMRSFWCRVQSRHKNIYLRRLCAFRFLCRNSYSLRRNKRSLNQNSQLSPIWWYQFPAQSQVPADQ